MATLPPTNVNGSQKPSPPEPELSTLDSLQQQASQAALKLRTLIRAVRAPLPTQTGDGSDLQALDQKHIPEELARFMRDLCSEKPEVLLKLATTFKASAAGNPLDDKEYLMEAMVQAAASIKPGSLQKGISELFISKLWSDLEHPPDTLLGDEYHFRQPDGSKNSYVFPDIGKAGMPYARTVAPRTKQRGALPDPGVLFDTLMARRAPAGEKHPNKISSMLFYLASIIIHDIFRTDHTDFRKSKTSSYLDLAPLYGSDWTEQRAMRTMKDGKIHPDCFSETRLLTFPPGVGALLILFNRYHNYVVENLAAINQDGRFSEDPEHPKMVDRYGEKINKRDDDLFQTARLVTCGLYINIILVDYVRTILNLHRTDSDWSLDPRLETDMATRATGNQVSAEFNLVYRWHSATSDKDDKWTQALFQQLPLPEKLKNNPAEAAKPEHVKDFLRVLGHMEADSQKLEPSDRPFPALKEERLDRIKEGPFGGNFEDDALAEILNDSIRDCANAMGPRQVPTIMKAIEVLGIQQARTWQCATLNEFRKRFALKPHEKFSDITDDAEVADALKHLYETPDQVELYPGLVVEDAKQPKLPGSGLCPSYTTSRGVLSDAVALVRGDRFYTTSYTPALLTNWGYEEASSDKSTDNGCVFYKLFLHGLPNNYDGNSIYAHYPLTVPDEMEVIMKGLGKAQLYDFNPPVSKPRPTMIYSHDAATKILEDQETFHVTWGPAMVALMGPRAQNFMLAGDGEKNVKSRDLMEKPMYPGGSSTALPKGNEPWLVAVRDFYETITTELLRSKSYKLAGVNQVDLIRDVGNLAHVHFGAELFSIPLKTEDFPHGVFSEQQLYLVMAAVFIAVFFDLDPSKSFPLRQKAKMSTDALASLIKVQVKALKDTGKLTEWLIERIKPTAAPLKQYGAHMLRKLVEADNDVEDLVWGNIMGTAGGMVANQGQLFGQALDYFFTDGQKHLPEINRLAKLDTPEADDTLMHYLMEGARLSGETGVFRQAQRDVAVVDDTAPLGRLVHELKAGDTLMIDLKAVSRDPIAFPDPDALDLGRDLEGYTMLGWGPHRCFGLPMTRVALTTMLKVVGRLDNLRPATVSVGGASRPSCVKKVVKEFWPGSKGTLPESWHYHMFMMEDWDMYFPFPMSLKVNFDGEIPDVNPRRAAA